MKKGVLFSAVTLGAGLVGAALRWMERTSGFESGTGLAVPGNGPAIALIVWSVLVAAALIVAVRKVRCGVYLWYDKVSLTQQPLCFAGLCAAAALMAVAGVVILGRSMTQAMMDIPRMILGVVAVGTAASLALTAKSNYKEREKGRYRLRLLVPAFFCCYWLVLAYEGQAANPVILAYGYQLFAIICSLLAFYYIAGIDFGKARVRCSMVFGYLACFFSLVTLADGHPVETVLLHLSVVLYLLVYLGVLTERLREED